MQMSKTKIHLIRTQLFRMPWACHYSEVVKSTLVPQDAISSFCSLCRKSCPLRSQQWEFQKPHFNKEIISNTAHSFLPFNEQVHYIYSNKNRSGCRFKPFIKLLENLLLSSCERQMIDYGDYKNLLFSDIVRNVSLLLFLPCMFSLLLHVTVLICRLLEEGEWMVSLWTEEGL